MKSGLNLFNHFQEIHAQCKKLSMVKPGLFFTDFPATTETGISKTVSLAKNLKFSNKNFKYTLQKS